MVIGRSSRGRRTTRSAENVNFSAWRTWLEKNVEASMHSQSFDLTDLIQKAEAGDPSAQFHLAVRYKDGSLVPKDLEAAKLWFMKAIAQGEGNAAIFMINLLREEGTPASLRLAFTLLPQIEEHFLGRRRPWEVFDLYESGCEFLREKEALLLLSGKGHVEAQLEIVRRYLVHRRVLDDRSEGLSWWLMPLFGIVPSILWVRPSPDQPPFDDEPAVSIALRNYRRAEQWFRDPDAN